MPRKALTEEERAQRIKEKNRKYYAENKDKWPTYRDKKETELCYALRRIKHHLQYLPEEQQKIISETLAGLENKFDGPARVENPA